MGHDPDDDFYEPSAQDVADITGDSVEDVETAWDDAQDDHDQSR